MNVVLASSVNEQIRQAIADIAEALLYPVLIAAIITLLFVAYELGGLGVEAWKRSQRPKTPFEQTARQAERAPRGEFVCWEEGNHGCSNIPYKARSLMADWLAEQLA